MLKLIYLNDILVKLNQQFGDEKCYEFEVIKFVSDQNEVVISIMMDCDDV